MQLLPTWRTLCGQLGFKGQTPSKRVSLSRNAFGIAAERLEDRALLSAGRGGLAAAPVAAHVGKAAFEVPNVHDDWDVAVDGQVNTSADFVMTQTGAKVTIVGTFGGEPPVTFTAKFRKNAPDTLSGKTPKLLLGDAPKALSFKVTMVFAPATGNAQTFTGSVSVKKVGQVATLNGERD